jgi:PPK2 family polyphosphate:nucleotide phosphotransferase
MARLLRGTADVRHPQELRVPITAKEMRQLFQVPTRGRVQLDDYDPGWNAKKEFKELSMDELKTRAKEVLQRDVASLADAQERLYASDTYSVLIVLQASDAAGKDGTIKHVLSGVNPQGCQVFAFKRPSSEELDHTFLWRYMKSLPERGRIGIFNRSYYEDVLVVRVHPELLSRVGRTDRGKDFWHDRYDDINEFEKHLTRNGTLVLKFFLNVSKDEQRKRFLERLERPEKNWKFSFGDLEERKYWSQYREAYEQMLQNTSTTWAPWWVIPADHKWVTRALVASIITRSIDDLGVQFPEVSKADRTRLAAARKELLAET